MEITGKSKICFFMGMGWPAIEKLIRLEGFPAQCVGGVWQSDSERITAWRQGRPPRGAAAPAPPIFQFREGYNGSSTTGIIQGGVRGPWPGAAANHSAGS
jgi:hypothetical protein